MEKKFTHEQLGVSPKDSVQLISYAVHKAIDNEFCGDAVITRINEKQGQIIVQFYLEAYQWVVLMNLS